MAGVRRRRTINGYINGRQIRAQAFSCLLQTLETLSSACGEVVHCCFIIITLSRCNSGLDASPVSAEHGRACPLRVCRDSALDGSFMPRTELATYRSTNHDSQELRGRWQPEVSGLTNTRPRCGVHGRLHALCTC